MVDSREMTMKQGYDGVLFRTFYAFSGANMWTAIIFIIILLKKTFSQGQGSVKRFKNKNWHSVCGLCLETGSISQLPPPPTGPKPQSLTYGIQEALHCSAEKTSVTTWSCERM